MKLKYLAKDHAEQFPEHKIVANSSFQSGFKTAFKTINESLEAEIAKLEQYPMMYERMSAVRLCMKKMDAILKESTDE